MAAPSEPTSSSARTTPPQRQNLKFICVCIRSSFQFLFLRRAPRCAHPELVYSKMSVPMEKVVPLWPAV